MGDHITLHTPCSDNGEAIARLASDLQEGDLVLEASQPVDPGSWVAFEVFLRDGQLFLEGMGRCAASQARAGRHFVRLGDLQLDAAGELLFERIQIARDDLEHGGRITGSFDLSKVAELSEEVTTVGVTVPREPSHAPTLSATPSYRPPPPSVPPAARPPPLAPGRAPASQTSSPAAPRPPTAAPIARPPTLPPRAPRRPPTLPPPPAPRAAARIASVRPPSAVPTHTPSVRSPSAVPTRTPLSAVPARAPSVRPPNAVPARTPSVRPPSAVSAVASVVPARAPGIGATSASASGVTGGGAPPSARPKSPDARASSVRLPPAPKVPTFAPDPPRGAVSTAQGYPAPKRELTPPPPARATLGSSDGDHTRVDARAPRETSSPLQQRIEAMLPRLVAEGRVRGEAELRELALRIGLEALEVIFPEE